MASRNTNTTIHSEGREIYANIVDKCNEEKARTQLLLRLSKATKQAAMYVGVFFLQSRKLNKDEKGNTSR
jgi:hypothetical protein